MLVEMKKSENLYCNMSGVEIISSQTITVTDPPWEKNQSVPTTPAPGFDSIYLYLLDAICIFLLALTMIMGVVFKRAKLHSLFKQSKLYSLLKRPCIYRNTPCKEDAL